MTLRKKELTRTFKWKHYIKLCEELTHFEGRRAPVPRQTT